MKIKTKRYQHFKGGLYLVYGDILPLPNGIHTEKFRFKAKESINATEVDVIVTNKGTFYAPFSDETMTLYFSEKTGEWWLRPTDEFHGLKTHDDRTSVKRFTLLEPDEEYTMVLLSVDLED